MKTKFTPGSWTPVECRREGWAIQGAPGTENPVACTDEYGCYGPIASEDVAKLISAAPDLLEALKVCKELLTYGREAYKALGMANAAITKATGEQE